MPNQPKTPGRSVRIPDDLWQRALETANTNGTTVTAEINRFLTRWTRTNNRRKDAA